jgi:hypothetical protein
MIVPLNSAENEYPEWISKGLASLKQKYGYDEIVDSENKLLVTNGQTADILFSDGVTRKLLLATPEYCNYVEQKLMKICSRYQDHIENMGEDEINAFSMVFLMAFDIDRGLGLGQVPHLKFFYSAEFLSWENGLWERIQKRENELGII